MSSKPELEKFDTTGAITVYEPVAKNPVDQLNTVLAAIDDAKKGPAPAQNYVSAFDPKSDDYHVQTDNANVTQTESLRSLFSTGPEIRDEDREFSPLFVIGIGLVVILLLKGKF